MKRIFILSLLAALFTFGAAEDLHAQRYGSGKKKKKKKEKTSKTDDYFDESGPWHTKLWYGVGGVLNYRRYPEGGIFNIGLSPQVGYNVLPWLSAGPRLSLIYSNYKGGAVDEFNRVIPGAYKANTWDYSLGLFTRAKVFNSFFVQVEGENNSEQFLSITQDSRGKLFFRSLDEGANFQKFRENRFNAFLGGGYNSSLGQLGYEVGIYFKLNQDVDDFSPPYEVRVGLTYGF